jgi:uncharacterized membrane protein YfcA
VAGALPGAQAGAYLAARLKPKALRYTLGGVVGLIAIRLWLDVILI